MKKSMIVIVCIVWLLVGCTPRYSLPVNVAEALDSMFEVGHKTFLQITVDGTEGDEWLQLYFRKVDLVLDTEEKEGQKPEEFKF